MSKTKASDSSEVESEAAPRRRLPPLLRRAWYSLNQAFRRRIAYSKLTPDQFTILRQLTECPREGLTQREISALMSSDPNTIASLLDRMQAAELVERRPHETDRRAHRVKLLPKGKKIFQELRDIAIDLQSQVLSVLPEDRREQFLAELEQVADACLQHSRPPAEK
jgi:DNA-binding MarR family transcriptional regulator